MIYDTNIIIEILNTAKNVDFWILFADFNYGVLCGNDCYHYHYYNHNDHYHYHYYNHNDHYYQHHYCSNIHNHHYHYYQQQSHQFVIQTFATTVICNIWSFINHTFFYSTITIVDDYRKHNNYLLYLKSTTQEIILSGKIQYPHVIIHTWELKNQKNRKNR